MRRVLVLMAVLAVLFGVSTPVGAQDIAAMSFEQLTVANASKVLADSTLMTGGKVAARCVGVLETAEIRIRVDGTAASATVGQVVSPGSVVDIRGVDNVRRFSAFRTGGTSGVLPMTCYPSPADTSPVNPITVSPTPAVTAANLMPDGTAALPSPAYASDTNSGLYRIGADNIGVSLGGAIEQNWTATATSPGASDGNALGTSTLMWSDLFLAAGGVINWNNGNATLTHQAGQLDFSRPISVANADTTAGAVKFFEDSDNGANAATLIGPASTADVTITLPASAGTVALVENKLSAFAATTSAELFGVVSDETGGTGVVVGSISPVFGTDATVGAIASQDVIKVLPVTSATRFTGTLSPADLTANVTWTMPMVDGYVATTGASDPRITAGSGTGVTVNEAVALRRAVYKVTVTYAQFDAAAVTHDLTIATLPAKTRLVGVYAHVSTPFVCAAVCTTATLSATLGTSAGGAEILDSFDIDAAAAVFGDTDAELGSAVDAAARVQDAYLASWSATQAIVLRATSGTGNWGNGSGTSNLNAGTVVFYLITEILP
ncbi:MAG: hypothetical protein NTY02_05045 [Acidobacteria bacterium]|nr:hypothetical protein [Acidobacteriota bacterium]